MTEDIVEAIAEAPREPKRRGVVTAWLKSGERRKVAVEVHDLGPSSDEDKAARGVRRQRFEPIDKRESRWLKSFIKRGGHVELDVEPERWFVEAFQEGFNEGLGESGYGGMVVKAELRRRHLASFIGRGFPVADLQPDDVPHLQALAAAYLEQGKRDEATICKLEAERAEGLLPAPAPHLPPVSRELRALIEANDPDWDKQREIDGPRPQGRRPRRVRRTPLRRRARGTAQDASRTRARRKRPWDDEASRERLYVLSRDRECVAALLARRGVIAPHSCRDEWGMAQSSVDAATMEHVKDEPGGARIHDRRHMVRCCHGGNVLEHVAGAGRLAFLAYIVEVEGPA